MAKAREHLLAPLHCLNEFWYIRGAPDGDQHANNSLVRSSYMVVTMRWDKARVTRRTMERTTILFLDVSGMIPMVCIIRTRVMHNQH